jgi:phenylacetate-CoA ligase
MFPAVVDWALRQFEWRASSPPTVKLAAHLLRKVLGRAPGGQIVSSIQARRLRSTVDYAYRCSPHYRELFDRLGLRPDHIRTREDLRKLPFTTENDIRAWRRFLCVSEDRLAAVFTTSGSTGEPKRVYFTPRDMQILVNLSALGLRIRHSGRLVALIALPVGYGLWIDSALAPRIVERAGGLPIPTGTDHPEETLRWMERFEPNVVIALPSYLAALTHTAEHAGYRPRLELILVGGEILTEDYRARFTEYWGSPVCNVYGMTEIGGGQLMAVPEFNAFSANDLHLVMEIVDPETGQPADEGELVFTTLGREAMPLLRYRSGDLGRWANTQGWLPLSAVLLTGRADDLLMTGGAHLYGHVMVEAIARIPGASGRVEVRLDRVELTDRLVVRVEGKSIEAEDVRQALFAEYPQMAARIASSMLILEIETDVKLGNQLKGLRVLDTRFTVPRRG